MPLPPPGRASTRASPRHLLYASEDVSVAPLLAIPSLLGELGVEPASVLERIGIEQHTLNDPANRIPYSLVGRLLEECAAASACPHFGLLVGIRSGPAAAGIAGRMFSHTASVHAALRIFIAHQHLHDRGGAAVIGVRTTGEAELAYVIHHPETPGASQILDLSIAVACGLMRHMVGPRWTPSAVLLSHAKPRSTRPYRSFFRAPIRLDAPYSALVFPARLLARSLVDVDPAEGDRLRRLAAALDAARPATLTELTIRALSNMVIAMPPSTDKVATVIGITPRRLRERLAAEGSSVKELLEDLRCELARQLLETRLPIGEIAATLHYSKPGAFSRAFKAWTGQTPRQWRKAVAPAPSHAVIESFDERVRPVAARPGTPWLASEPGRHLPAD